MKYREYDSYNVDITFFIKMKSINHISNNVADLSLMQLKIE
jgi:hypothetical protein